MKILFCHTNYPAQFRRLAPALAEHGHEVVFLHKNIEWHAEEYVNVVRHTYSPSRLSGSADGTLHPYLGRFEDAVLEGQAATRAALRLKESGFNPDVIVSHAGFGNGLYLKDVFPGAHRIGFFEWYYRSGPDSDVHFLHNLSGQEVPLDRAMRLRTWNAVTLLELAQCDALVTPTAFQRQQFPEPFRDRFHLIHEGVNASFLRTLREAPPEKPSFLPNDPSIRVVSHVARGFELYRGFPQAIAALVQLQRSMTDVHVFIAGADQVCYGGPSNAPNGKTWGAWAKEDAGLDPARTHWLGVLSTSEYEALLAYTDAHLYLTIPFVLSWSLIEAMAVGAPLVASDTGPIRELLTHNKDALLAPFDQPLDLAHALESCLQDQPAARRRAAEAQARSLDYDASIGLQGWTRLLGEGVCQSGKPENPIDLVFRRM